MDDPIRAEIETGAFDPLVDQAPSRYVIGIDLGTTNSAVMYVDTEESPWKVRTLLVPQLVAPGQVEARDTLPSFHYQAGQGEFAPGAFQLPWQKQEPTWTVGFLARDEGTKSPGRLIASAKSWLCHSGVDRSANLLPWQGAPDVERLSPVEASSRYLGHIRDAWNHEFPLSPLADQDVVLTLPASFDEVARELTVEAAARAGIPRVYLIEEPQAAFYAWVYKHQDVWQSLVHPGESILVCDIGGGTSDFTLIHVRASETDGADIQFHRLAVGEHLILGGDNLDLALAHFMEGKLVEQTPLAPKQWDVLVRNCRRVKETLLGIDPPASVTVHLPGSGSRLIGSGIQMHVTRDEVHELLVGGFLPEVALEERPTQGQSGFREFGLPYASDPAITKHLATFLTAHGDVVARAMQQNVSSRTLPGESYPAIRNLRGERVVRPDVVLFNGGFFESPVLRGRLLSVLERWFTTDDGKEWSPRVLDHDRLDLAVARGAAYFGMVRRGEGVRIAANLARSYYIDVCTDSGERQAICLVPGNAEPGREVPPLGRQFELAIAEPVEFGLFVSSTRLTDEPGDLVPIDVEHLKPLPPIRTVLHGQRRNERGKIPVQLRARLTEIGTLDLWCQRLSMDDSREGQQWRLQFDVRSTTQTDREAHETAAEQEGIVDEGLWEACRNRLLNVFQEGSIPPNKLMKELGEVLNSPRLAWPSSLLRRIWETLMELESGRRKSAEHEMRWLNLLGFALRPGYGLALDDWRVAETWRHVRGKLAYGGPATQQENLILWRRLAGGLSPGQQMAVAEPIVASVRNAVAVSAGQKSRPSPFVMHESQEAWRLLGSLELLAVPLKTQLGEAILDLGPRKKYEKVSESMLWALGRLGQRVPLVGPLNTVLPTSETQQWIDTLLSRTAQISYRTASLTLMQLSRRTGDRYRDIDESLRRRVAERLEQDDAPTHWITLVRDGGQLESEVRDQLIGESLPTGLRLR